MLSRRHTRSTAGTALALALGTVVLGACAHIKPPPVPTAPGLAPPRVGAAVCVGALGRAHEALAAAGAAAGDPAGTAAAHADHAAAMHEYHTCLARRDGDRP